MPDLIRRSRPPARLAGSGSFLYAAERRPKRGRVSLGIRAMVSQQRRPKSWGQRHCMNHILIYGLASVHQQTEGLVRVLLRRVAECPVAPTRATSNSLGDFWAGLIIDTQTPLSPSDTEIN